VAEQLSASQRDDITGGWGKSLLLCAPCQVLGLCHVMRENLNERIHQEGLDTDGSGY
jgi:hypothetical protein